MDLDLRQLKTLFPNVNLLDLDRKAVESGVGAVESLSSSELQIVGPIDLASPLATMKLSDLQETAAITQFCKELAAPFAVMPVEAADVVVSTCVLSQMLSAMTNLVTDKHPHFLPLIQAVRRGHLVRMLQLLKSGGRGILISDLFSSESTPQLTSIDEAGLPKLLAQALAAGNFFLGASSGCDAAGPWNSSRHRIIDRISRYDRSVALADGARAYAVYAITFRRK